VIALEFSPEVTPERWLSRVDASLRAWHPSISSLAVALSLDVLTRRWYRPTGSAIPPRTRRDATPSGGGVVPRGLPKHPVAAGASQVPVQPIHGVAPATEYDHRRRPRIWHAYAAPLLRFRLLQHCPAAESTATRFRVAPGFASPGTFRPQGFAPSRRFAPRTACPALFRAGALLEFHALQSFSLVRSRGASRRPLCLLAIRCCSQQPAVRSRDWPVPC